MGIVVFENGVIMAALRISVSSYQESVGGQSLIQLFDVM